MSHTDAACLRKCVCVRACVTHMWVCHSPLLCTRPARQTEFFHRNPSLPAGSSTNQRRRCHPAAPNRPGSAGTSRGGDRGWIQAPS